MADTATIIGLISSSAIGFALGSLSDLFKHQLILKRDREARASERKKARTVQRSEFQRESLLSLQEAATSLMDATIESYRDGWGKSIGQPSTTMSSIDIDRAYWKADAMTHMLQVRVRDKQIREKCDAFRKKCSEAAEIFPDHAKAKVSSALEAVKQIHEEVGKAITALDDESCVSRLGATRRCNSVWMCFS
jgi:hypothetical protein